MKKNIFSFLLFIISSNAFAQDTTKAKLRKWGVGLQVNTINNFFPYENILGVGAEYSQGTRGKQEHKSFSSGLSLIYFTKENMYLQFKIDMTNINTTYYRDTRNEIGTTYLIGDGTAKQKRYCFSPAIAYTIRKNKLSGSFGFELPVNIYKNYIVEVNGTFYTDSTYSTISATSNDIITTPGGFAIGVAAFAGFNINIIKHFSIGAEFSSALLYSKFGGQVIHTSPMITGVSDHYLSAVENIAMSMPKLSFNIICFF